MSKNEIKYLPEIIWKIDRFPRSLEEFKAENNNLTKLKVNSESIQHN